MSRRQQQRKLKQQKAHAQGAVANRPGSKTWKDYSMDRGFGVWGHYVNLFGTSNFVPDIG